MQSLEAFSDVMVPNKQLPCFDNELINPREVQRISTYYQRLYSQKITNDLRLTDAFFSAGASGGFVGYKSMPHRHGSVPELMKIFGIQFITLYRRDIAATIASFIIAKKYDEWRRAGEEQKRRLVFDADLHDDVMLHVNYIARTHTRMREIPDAIEVYYEDMCTEDFDNPALNNYFGRRVELKAPKPPISVSQYVTNWQAYTEFVRVHYARLSKEWQSQPPQFP